MVIIKNNIPLKLTNKAVPHFISFDGLADDREHIALVFDGKNPRDETYVRIHRECLTKDVLEDEGGADLLQLQETIELFTEIGGVILYLRQEGSDIDLYERLGSYDFRVKNSRDGSEGNDGINHQEDEQNYTIAGQMLKALNKQSIVLLGSNPDKKRQLEEFGIGVFRMQPIGVFETAENKQYLTAKQNKTGPSIKEAG